MTSYLDYVARWFRVLMPALLLLGLGLSHASALKFADQLYSQGDYTTAATEYKRILYQEADNSADSLYAVQMLMRSLFQASDRAGMFQVCHQYAGYLTPADLAARYNALLMIRDGYYLPAYSLLDRSADPRAKLLRGLSLEYLGKSEEAVTQLRELSLSDSATARLAEEALRIRQKTTKPHTPSPLLAGAFGILPGLGYAVTGRFETALASLVINSALLISSIELYQNDLQWSAGIVFSVFTGFYLGNIYGSASAAAKDRAIYKAAILDEFLKINVDELLSAPGTIADSP